MIGALPGLSVATVPSQTPESETSFQLLLRARAGDQDALERLCACYLPRLTRWAEGRMPRDARGALDTGDIVQEVLMQVLKRLPMFDPREPWSFPAYLRRALMNRLRDEARRARRHPAAGPLDSQAEALDPSPFDQLVGVEGRERYEAALERLRPHDQQAIVTRCEWNMSYEEIAALLGKTTVNATRVAIHRALVRLAKEMADVRR
jgi:RNA polymerase sigma-70 factor, ECF subfamily